jgi:hypothetical protein
MMGEIELVKNLEGWAGPLIYNWDALFGSWEIRNLENNENPFWAFRRDDYRICVHVHVFSNSEIRFSTSVDERPIECWKEFSWMLNLNQEEILGLANYCHKRLPFVPQIPIDNNVLENLTKYGVLGPRAMEGKKKFWKK